MRKIEINQGKINKGKLLAFGFAEANGECSYTCALVNGQMNLTIRLIGGCLYSEVTDELGEEYTLHLSESAEGSFVGAVRCEYESRLGEILDACLDIGVFVSEQAHAACEYVRQKYGDELEFLWKKFSDNAIVRRADTGKWYLALLTISRRKLGLRSDEKIEIIDLRMTPEDIEKTVDGKKYFCGYHMNKRHWITICLDGSLNTDEILDLIDASYLLAK